MYIYIYIHMLIYIYRYMDTKIQRGVSLRANASPARALTPRSTDTNRSTCSVYSTQADSDFKGVDFFQTRGHPQNYRPWILDGAHPYSREL